MIEQSEELCARCPRVWEVWQSGLTRKLHHGMQLYVSQHGRPLVNVALGLAGVDQPMTTQTLVPWLSAGKPLTAIALARAVPRLSEIALLPVGHFIPEFAANGKGVVTVDHLLTHTAALRSVDTGWPHMAWHETVERLCQASLDAGAVPGKTAAYHIASSWFVLGEILQRLTHESFEEAVSRLVVEPLGMRDTYCCCNPPALRDGAVLGQMWERVQGELQLLDWHLPPRIQRPSPGSSFRGPVSSLGRFYEGLLDTLIGDRTDFLSRTNLEEVVQPVRIDQYDETLGHIVDFGRGVIVNSNRYGAETVPYGFGRYAGPRTFGHGGSQSSMGFCDPDHGVVVAWMCNGRCGEGQHQRRNREFNTALYQDLGLVDHSVTLV